MCRWLPLACGCALAGRLPGAGGVPAPGRGEIVLGNRGHSP